MPTVWTHFSTQGEAELAMARLEFAGIARERIDRIEDADGRWSVGTYVDHADEPHVRGLMTDRYAPTRADVTNLAVIGAAVATGLAAWYLLPARRRQGS
ncbi:hypothetical protein [Salinarimonas soli]|uniref:Uncharacterized protein n=1 Tax=Salinarimonas soli TaxID=1638099 RepID=A0A5B2W0G7_9HYPH|nr:hypothetical protein [Salinarimonas soli]KAA2244092.1 hypothetical protein F0L46_02305 [Salinarimonas soli]